MSLNVDTWPSTPVKLITSWAFSVIFFVFSLVLIWTNRHINDAVFMTLAAVVFGHDAIGAAQMIGKRATAWEPGAQPETGGQTVNIAMAPESKTPP